MTEKKIFSPSIMLIDSYKQVWCKNIENVDGRIPIHQSLKAAGIYALDIKPIVDSVEGWFVFSFPLNSQWCAMDLSIYKMMTFDIASSSSFQLNIDLINNEEQHIQSEKLRIEYSDIWTTYVVKIDGTLKINTIKLISFSGSSTAENFLIRNIILK